MYLEEGLQNRWFDFGGNTIVDTNKHIRLTSTASSQQGYLWSRLVKKKKKRKKKDIQPMKLNYTLKPINAQDFEIEFEFKVGGSTSKLHGDGFACKKIFFLYISIKSFIFF